MVAVFMIITKQKMHVILSIGSLEPQFTSGLAQLLELPILLEKGASFDANDRKQVKMAIQEKIIRQIYIIG